MAETNWNPEEEERLLFAISPHMQEIADTVRAKLPPGTDFGVLVVAPASVPGAEGRVLAITTDRTRMATYAAQWVLTVLPRKTS
jgi:hypothetical protein